MKKLSLLLAASLLLSLPAAAQLKKMGISDVKANPALAAAAARNDTVLSLDRVVQAFDSQLTDRMQNSRRFTLVARSDMAQILKEADFSGGAFKTADLDYLVVTTLDDFQDYKESLVLPTTGERLSKRVIRVTAVVKIYDTVSGVLKESANVTRTIQDAGGEFNSARSGDLTDSLMLTAVQEISQASVDRVLEVLFPARVLARTGNQVTINRGDGTSIAVGQTWLAFAEGEALIDPDTGESFGKERIAVGKVRITRVTPRTSTAEVIEDAGIGPGVVLEPQ